jgi:hypothetical protein
LKSPLQPRASRFDPAPQIRLRPRRQRALPRRALFRPAQPFPGFVGARLFDRREQAEIDVHGLERARAGLDRFEVAAGDVVQQCADRGGRRKRRQLDPEPFGGGEAARDQADRGAFDVAFAAGDLAGEAQAGRGPQAQAAVEQPRRIQERVAVQAAEPRELRMLQAGNHPEHARLLAIFQLGLKTHHVEQRAQRVVLP